MMLPHISGRRLRLCKSAKPQAANWVISTTAGEGLAFLAADNFVLVADALALVGFRLADRANLGGILSDCLLVRAADNDRVRVRHLDGHALGRLLDDVIRIADRQHDRLRLAASLVA